MSNIHIRTNHHYRPIISYFELTDKEQEEIDYYETEEGLHSALFFRYRGDIYDLDDFWNISTTHYLDHPVLKNWDGISNDSYSTGMLIKISKDCESVKVASYSI